jgi:pyruvate,orthophosphate dikinase
MQQADFEALYETMLPFNVNVRLLDPPLHEFLPQEEELIKELAEAIGKTVEQVKDRIEELHEANPMMGHRGCRLAVTYPEICVMQTNAIIKAAIAVTKKTGTKVEPEIMVPLVLEERELKFVKDIILATAEKLIAESGLDLNVHVGTMIEIPRAALLADEIAKHAEFFSFGTNDLTQMTFGFSRDDAGKFLPSYYDTKILEEDPFKTLDQSGVGKLVENAVKLGRLTRPELHIGVCGETGGEAKSIEFYHKVGLDYVSCSPFRVPVARLAAAQAAIKFPRKK